MHKRDTVIKEIGRGIIIPLAIIPVAAVLIYIGKQTELRLEALCTIGTAIMDSIPIIIAMSIAAVFSNGNDISIIATFIGYKMMSITMKMILGVSSLQVANGNLISFNEANPPGILGAVLLAYIINLIIRKDQAKRSSGLLGFFSGKRLTLLKIIAVSAFLGVVLGAVLAVFISSTTKIILGVFKSSNYIGIWMSSLFKDFVGYMGVKVETIGELLKGAGDKRSFSFGMYSPIPFFAIPGCGLIIYKSTVKEKKKNVVGLIIVIFAVCIISEEMLMFELLLFFLSFPLFLIHILLSSIVGTVGYFIYSMNADISIYIKMALGIGCFVSYYFFTSLIVRRSGLRFYGREQEKEILDFDSKIDKEDLPIQLVKNLGGNHNIVRLNACITRLRISLNDFEEIDTRIIEEMGIKVVATENEKKISLIFGRESQNICSQMKRIIEKKVNNGELVNIDSIQLFEIAEIQKENRKKDYEIVAPMSGELLELEDVPDKVFSERLMGEGFAILPEDGEVCCPVDGVVSMVFPSKHAIGITSLSGFEVLIHFGVDTVRLNGKGFEIYVDQGENVIKGQPIMSVDLSQVKKESASIITPVVINNLGSDKEVKVYPGKKVKIGEEGVVKIVYTD